MEDWNWASEVDNTDHYGIWYIPGKRRKNDLLAMARLLGEENGKITSP
jgi:hypothetical protein